jgi:VanZ family protein
LLQSTKIRISNLAFQYGYLQRRAIAVLALLTVCGILIVGLWPFQSPRNRVHWLEHENGLQFDRYGTILSTGILERASSDRPSTSLEFWMAPSLTWDTGTLIAFYDPLTDRQFSLHQRYTDLVLERETGDPHHQPALVEMKIHNVFRKKQALITVTSDGKETAIYIDGQLATRSAWFGLSADDLTGRLIVATTALQSHSWSGQVRGIALYRSKLSPQQTVRHYADWMQKGGPGITDEDRALAVYLFDERAGTTIHNQITSGTDLYIPERYLVVHQILLESAPQEFHKQRNYLKNAFINVAGFVPLGFFLHAYFSAVRRIRYPALATVMIGATMSLTIEVLQAYLPTRDSGMTDVITNTLGTCIGSVLCHAAALPLGRLLGVRHYVENSDISSVREAR